MDRRQEPRIAVEEQGWMTILGSEPEIRCSVTAIDVSGRGIKLRLGRQVMPNTPVKIEVGDSMYLGEVCYCRLERGAFIAGLAIEQVLTGLHGLAKLRRKLIQDLPVTMPSSGGNPDARATRDEEYEGVLTRA